MEKTEIKKETFCVEIDKNYYIKKDNLLNNLKIKNKKILAFFVKL